MKIPTYDLSTYAFFSLSTRTFAFSIGMIGNSSVLNSETSLSMKVKPSTCCKNIARDSLIRVFNVCQSISIFDETPYGLASWFELKVEFSGVRNFRTLRWMQHYLSRVMRKPTFLFATWSDTNQAVQLQKMARGLKFSDLESRGIVLSM